VTWGVKLLAPVDISTHAPWITLDKQHIMACASTIVLECKIPHKLNNSNGRPLEEGIL
jgi:hypothetical protein